MKRLIWLMGPALLSMVVLGACSDKKVNKNVDLDDEDEELVEDEDEADDTGGNMIRGTFRGKPIKVANLGD